MFTTQCVSCRPSHDESNTLVATEVGRAILRQDDQGPIGRCIFVPHKHISTMEELLANTEIIIAAYDFARRLNNTLKALYGCTKVAVCMIGNLTKDEHGEITTEQRYEHRHYHIIPSYPKPVERYGTIFTDDNYGKPMNLDEHRGYVKKPVGNDILLQICHDIQNALNDHL